MKKLTKEDIKRASKLAVKNLKPLDGAMINALNAIYRADKFKPLKDRRKL